MTTTNSEPRGSSEFITEAEVHAACEELDREGLEPSAGALRIRLGHRGSKSTILKHRASWSQKRKAGVSIEPVPAMPDDLRQAAVEHAGRIWTAAYGLAERLASDALVPLNARIAELEATAAETDGFVAVLEAENVRLQAETARAQDIVSSLRAELDGEKALRGGLEGELRGLRRALDALSAAPRTRPAPSGDDQAVEPDGRDAAVPSGTSAVEDDPAGEVPQTNDAAAQPVALRRAPVPLRAPPVTSRPPSAASA